MCFLIKRKLLYTTYPQLFTTVFDCWYSFHLSQIYDKESFVFGQWAQAVAIQYWFHNVIREWETAWNKLLDRPIHNAFEWNLNFK